MINPSDFYKNSSLDDMEGEIWKDIPGYESIFMVSNMGRVKKRQYETTWKGTKYRLVPEKIIRPTINPKGYAATRLFVKKLDFKPFTVHKLVMLAFQPDRPIGMDQINHKNGCKTDNRVDNLEYSNNSHNIKHAWSTGLFNPKLPDSNKSPHAKHVLHTEYGVFFTIIEAAKVCGINRATMSKALQGGNLTISKMIIT